MKNITLGLCRPYSRDQSAAIITPHEFTFKAEFTDEQDALAFQIKLFNLIIEHTREATL